VRFPSPAREARESGTRQRGGKGLGVGALGLGCAIGAPKYLGNGPLVAACCRSGEARAGLPRI
jgi:hypothetical protein